MNKEGTINTISEEQLLHNKLSYDVNQDIICLMKKIAKMQEYNLNLQQRIYKAIKYIDSESPDAGVSGKKIKSILKGENNEVKENTKVYVVMGDDGMAPEDNHEYVESIFFNEEDAEKRAKFLNEEECDYEWSHPYFYVEEHEILEGEILKGENNE